MAGWIDEIFGIRVVWVVVEDNLSLGVRYLVEGTLCGFYRLSLSFQSLAVMKGSAPFRWRRVCVYLGLIRILE